MANRIRGEVDFESERGRLTLKYDVNALCELEEELDIGIQEFGEMFAGKRKVRLKHVRAAFWAGLRHHRPEITVNEAGELIMEIGGMVPALELIGKAFELAFPDKVSSSGESDERPRSGRGSKTPGEGGAPPTSAQMNSGDTRRERSVSSSTV